MPMFAWGLDEVLEAIGLFYALLVGLLMLLVSMERGLTEAPKPHTWLVRELSRQWLNDTQTQHEPVIAWLSRTPTWDSTRLARKLHLSSEETARLLSLAGYHEVRPGQWRARVERDGRSGG
jgi:hypothetical protein